MVWAVENGGGGEPERLGEKGNGCFFVCRDGVEVFILLCFLGFEYLVGHRGVWGFGFPLVDFSHKFEKQEKCQKKYQKFLSLIFQISPLSLSLIFIPLFSYLAPFCISFHPAPISIIFPVPTIHTRSSQC